MGNRDAKDLVNQNNLRDVAPAARPHAPGKGTQVGDDYADHGAYCDGNTNAGCFLEAGQRGRLIQQFQNRVDKALIQYTAAATAVQVQKLIKKPDDMHWLAALLLDLVVGHVGKEIGKAITNFKTQSKQLDAALKALNAKGVDVDDLDSVDLSSFDPKSIHQRARLAVQNTSDESLKKSAAKAVESAKKGVLTLKKKSDGEDAKSAQTAQISYLDQLMAAANIGYTALGEQTPANATDAELIALFHAMAPEHHQKFQYQEAITEKVDRFMKSGVRDIGVHKAERGLGILKDEDIHNPKGQSIDVVRHTRVVWREYVSGYPKDLVYEHQDGKRDPNYAQAGDPELGGTKTFGPSHAITKEAELGKFVPREFHEAALLQHESAWGEAPRTIKYDDSVYWWDLDRVNAANKAKAPKPPKPKYTNDGKGGFFNDMAAGRYNKPQQQQPAAVQQAQQITDQLMWQDIDDKK